VYNNFALAVANWVPGFALSLADEVDFCGGDMYGDATEQLVVSKLMVNLSKSRPAEFMTSLCVNLRDHVRLRSADELRMKAWASLAHGAATLFIDAIDPDGTVDAARYDMTGEIFSRTAPYEPFIGGEPRWRTSPCTTRASRACRSTRTAHRSAARTISRDARRTSARCAEPAGCCSALTFRSV
jgi:hypothetical protein